MSLDSNNVRVLVRELIDDVGPAAESWVIRFTRAISDDEIQDLVNARLGPQRLVDNRTREIEDRWCVTHETIYNAERDALGACAVCWETSPQEPVEIGGDTYMFPTETCEFVPLSEKP